MSFISFTLSIDWILVEFVFLIWKVSETLKGKPTIEISLNSAASLAPLEFATILNNFESELKSSKPKTSLVSFNWGIALAETKLPKSTTSKPTFKMELIYSAFNTVGINS